MANIVPFIDSTKVTAWVSDSIKHKFTLEIRKGDQKQILEEITGGKMASAVEGVLRSIPNPNYYENVQIKLIKIM